MTDTLCQKFMSIEKMETMIQNTDTFVLILIAGWTLLFLYIFLLLVKGVLAITKRRKYCRVFLNSREEKEDILSLLKEVLEYYKDHSKEGIALLSAIDYLEHSMLKDYETAFHGIEQVIKGKKVKIIHEDTIQFYQDRRNMTARESEEIGIPSELSSNPEPNMLEGSDIFQERSAVNE